MNMAFMHECPICGKMSLKIWRERHDFWGSPCYEDMEECLNPYCGEEHLEDDEEE